MTSLWIDALALALPLLMAGWAFYHLDQLRQKNRTRLRITPVFSASFAAIGRRKGLFLGGFLILLAGNTAYLSIAYMPIFTDGVVDPGAVQRRMWLMQAAYWLSPLLTITVAFLWLRSLSPRPLRARIPAYFDTFWRVGFAWFASAIIVNMVAFGLGATGQAITVISENLATYSAFRRLAQIVSVSALILIAAPFLLSIPATNRHDRPDLKAAKGMRALLYPGFAAQLVTATILNGLMTTYFLNGRGLTAWLYDQIGAGSVDGAQLIEWIMRGFVASLVVMTGVAWSLSWLSAAYTEVRDEQDRVDPEIFS